jgi:pyridoxamine 5'-phosphate oxidase
MDNIREHIVKLREDFIKGELSENDIDSEPSKQFQLWLKQAIEAKIDEFQAMNLATVSAQGKPSTRIVYLREFENDQYWFYTNFNSQKSQDLKTNANVCVNFFWKELERQVRINGTVMLAAPEMSDAYFNARPFDSKIGSWASQQSSILSSRTELENRVEELKKQFSPETIQRPEHWGGYVINANYYEFWQGRKSRLHDRISYTKNKDSWQIQRLAP